MSAQSYHRFDDAEAYRSNASFVYSSEYTAPVLRLLDAQPGDRILDLGCGSGQLTLELARAVGASGSIVGQDASSDMIEKATTLYQAAPRSSDLAPITFTVQDGHDAIPPSQHAQFDKVFSNAALHWIKRSPSQVLSNIHSSLKPAARFAAELGGFMNCIGVRSHLHLVLRKRNLDPTPLDPWFFPCPAQYTALLQEAGFTVESCEIVPRLTPLPKETGLKGWLKTFAGPFLNAIPSEEERQQVVNQVVEALRPDAYDVEGGVWSVMYVCTVEGTCSQADVISSW